MDPYIGPKPRFPRLLTRPFKHSSRVKLTKLATASSHHLADVAKDFQPCPPTKKTRSKSSMRIFSKAVPCASSKGHAVEDGEEVIYEGKTSQSPRLDGDQECPNQAVDGCFPLPFATTDIPVTFDYSTRMSILSTLYPGGSSALGITGGHIRDWNTPREYRIPPHVDNTPPKEDHPSPSPSLAKVLLSPRTSISSGGMSEPAMNNISVVEELAVDLSTTAGVPEPEDDELAGDASSQEDDRPIKMTWSQILEAIKDHLAEDPYCLLAVELGSILSETGMVLRKKDPAVDQMSLFQLNKVISSHDEADAQMIMDWQILHPGAEEFIATYPALTRLVDSEGFAKFTSSDSARDMVAAEDSAWGVDKAVESMDSVSVYSQQTSPSPSSELIPRLMLSLPTEPDLALEPDGEERVPEPELLSTAWEPAPKESEPVMEERRVYSAMPAKRRGLSRLRKVASAPDLQLLSQESCFDESDDDESSTIVASRRASSFVSAGEVSVESLDSSSVMKDDTSANTFVSDDECRKSDVDVGHLYVPQNQLGANLSADTSMGSLSSKRGSILDLGFACASGATPEGVFVSLPADDRASISGFVSAPSSPILANHPFEGSSSEIVNEQVFEVSAYQSEGCSRPAALYGVPLDLESLRFQINKVEETIVANAKRASISVPGTPVVKPDPRDPRTTRRGSMMYKPRPFTGIRPLMLPMRMVLRDHDGEDGVSKTITHLPGMTPSVDATLIQGPIPF